MLACFLFIAQSDKYVFYVLCVYIYIYMCVCMCALGVFHTYTGIIWHP